MSKKVSELANELEMSVDEVKIQSERLGIKVDSSDSTISDADAKRLTSTMNLLRGNASLSAKKSSGPKIKAVPIKNSPAVKAMAKPKAKVKDKAEDKAEAAAEESKKEKPAETENSAEKTAQPEKKAEQKSSDKAEASKAASASDKPKASADDNKSDKSDKKEEKNTKKSGKSEKNDGGQSKKSDEDKKSAKSGNKKSDASASKESSGKKADKSGGEKKAKKSEPKEEEYHNAPNKPMRFKKIFDAASAPKPKPAPKKNSSRHSRKDKDESEGRNSHNHNHNRRRSQNNENERSSASSAPSGEGSRNSRGKSKKFFEHNKDRHGRYKHEEGGRNSRFFDGGGSLKKHTHHKKKNKVKITEPEETPIEETLPEGTIAVTAPITVAGLAEQAEVTPASIIMSLMKLGVMATINQSLDKDTIEMLAEDLGVNVVVTEEEPEVVEEGLDLHEDTESELEPRAPIITVMGHVDHGKTSLLDAIRNTNVTAKESGGITQHIGASEVRINGKKIVFLDTPGHEAFTTMRARGAQITDIAVLVVAADDGVMPQTIESISHAKAANVPIIVAINKMDKPGANPDLVKKELADHGVLVEDWGGDVISVPVSAKKGTGIQDLLEMILLQAEVLELKANPNRLALGNVIEARLDKAKGPVATLLVMNGTLKTGQSIVAGTCHGRIRLMTNYKGDTIRKAGPATPVEVLGLNDVPLAGDAFNAVKDDKTAREIAENRAEKVREEVLAKNSSMTLEKLFEQVKEGETQELNLIIKADVQGSVGAIVTSLEKLNNDDVKVNIVHSGVGTITESDVMLAETSNAVIIGFNVRPTTAVSNQADDAGVELRTYRVIYDIIDDVEAAMKGMLAPEYKEQVLGKVEVRDTFKVPNVGTVAGGYVLEGKIQRNAQIRLVRDGIVIHEGTISSLRRFKDDVKEVARGFECGIGIEDYNDIKIGDVMECFQMVEVKPE